MSLQRISGMMDFFVCPICLEEFHDQRILSCGHHFCSGCLRTWSTNEGKAGITCPVCRAVTNSHPSVLPKSVIVEQLQQRINTQQNYCALCNIKLFVEKGRKKYNGDRGYFCLQCHFQLCLKCCKSHCANDLFANHQTMILKDDNFCPRHSTEPFIGYCQTCNVCLCKYCASSNLHMSHSIRPLDIVAKEARKQLLHYIEILRNGQHSEIWEHVVERYHEFANDCNLYKETIFRIFQIFNKLMTSFREIEKELDGKMLQEVKRIDSLEKMYKKPAFHKENLSNSLLHAESLLIQDNDIIIVKEMKDFLDKQAFPYNKDNILDLPVVPRGFDEVENILLETLKSVTRLDYGHGVTNDQSIQSLQAVEVSERTKDLKTPQTEHLICKSSTKNNKISNFPLQNNEASPLIFQHWVHAMLIDLDRNISVRTEDPKHPLKQFSRTGSLITQFTCEKGKHEIINIGRMALDTHREVYLVPSNGCLLRINPKGDLIDKISFEGIPRGIAYAASADKYIMTDVALKEIFVLDPASSNIVSKFSENRAESDTLESPLYVHVHESCNGPFILVSDSIRNCINVYDINGNLTQTYGPYGHDIGQLADPRGICTDKLGRIIICDYGNKRVVSCWLEHGLQRWEVLLSLGDKEDDAPYDVVIDLVDGLTMLLCGKYKSTLRFFKL